MSRRDPFDVVVVGAGMVGSASALRLVQLGLRVALVEQAAPTPWQVSDELDLRVVALAPSAVGLLERLDVWAPIVAARVSAYRRMQVWDAIGAGELCFDAADSGAAALGYIVENRLVQHALWRALQASAVQVHCPARVVALDADAALSLLSLDDGSRLHARLVVAADGMASPLRALAGIDSTGHGYGQRALVAHVQTERAHAATAWQRFLPGGPLAFLPLADGRCSIVWSLPEADAARLLALEPAAFCTALGTAFDFRLGSVTACSARAAFPLQLQLAQRYVAPRLALIGDAAHVVHPLAGQGVNLGLRDVDALAKVLQQAMAAERDIGSVAVLRRYERQRRSENTLAARSFDTINQVFSNANPLLAAGRGAALAALNVLTPLKQRLIGHAGGRRHPQP